SLDRYVTFPLHVHRSRAGHACDKAGASLERQITPGPVHRDRKTIAKSNEKVDVSDTPKKPGDKAREFESAELGHRALTPDRRQRAEIAVVEWRRLLSGRARQE